MFFCIYSWLVEVRIWTLDLRAVVKKLPLDHRNMIKNMMMRPATCPAVWTRIRGRLCGVSWKSCKLSISTSLLRRRFDGNTMITNHINHVCVMLSTRIGVFFRIWVRLEPFLDQVVEIMLYSGNTMIFYHILHFCKQPRQKCSRVSFSFLGRILTPGF